MLSTHLHADETVRLDSAEDLITEHDEEIADIVQASGLRPHESRSLIEAPIGGLARYVSRLPATRDVYYSAPSGLFRFSLDCALLAARKAQVWEFSGLGHIERRRIEAPRWRVACILAALLGDVHRAVTQCIVWGNNERWSPLAEPLTRFGERQAERRVRLEWVRRAPEGRSWNVPLTMRILDDSVLDFFNEGDPKIVADFFSVLGCKVASDGSVIGTLVNDARARLLKEHGAVGVANTADTSSRSAGESVPGVRGVEEATPADRAAEALPAAGDSLDYRTRLFIGELRKLLLKPRSSKGRVSLEPDGRLRIGCEWVRTLGFDAAQLCSRLATAGWITDPQPVRDAMFLNEKVSEILLKDVDRGSLLAAIQGRTQGSAAG